MGSQVEADAFRPGCHVKLYGLKSAPSLNEQRGVLEAFIDNTGRWRVKLETGERKDLKCENLEIVVAIDSSGSQPAVCSPKPCGTGLQPGCKVKLQRLKNALELNGQIATLDTFIDATARWRVKLDGGQVKDLKAENLETIEAVDQALKKQAEAMQQSTELGRESGEGLPSRVPIAKRPRETCKAKPVGGQRVSHEPFEHTRDALQPQSLAPNSNEDYHEQSKRLRYAVKAANLKAGDTCGPNGRFVVLDMLGEGEYSTVWRCSDALSPVGAEYALKVTRANAETRKAMEREIELMRHLTSRAGQWDREGSKCLLCLAFPESFEHQGHLAVVFESMKHNLMTTLRRHGRGKGLPLLPTVRNFGKQLFLALRALRLAGLIHCDVKPENLLLAKDSESIKLSDFGCTLLCQEAEKVKTDVMQPRFYRAPEIILGQSFDSQIDMWSAGATLFQLATDRILFGGESNNKMLHHMLLCCGPFPQAMATTGRYSSNHFDESGEHFVFGGAGTDEKPAPSETLQLVSMKSFDPPSRPVAGLLADFLKEPQENIEYEFTRFEFLRGHLAELLRLCVEPDPAKRAKPEVALGHRFFQKSAGDALADLCWLYQDAHQSV